MPPSTRPGIVEIVNVTAAVALAVRQVAGSVLEKDWIGDALFVVTRHVIDAFQRCQVERLARAVIDQRVVVHVTGTMEATTAVKCEPQVIVTVPAGNGGGRLHARPVSRCPVRGRRR